MCLLDSRRGQVYVSRNRARGEWPTAKVLTTLRPHFQFGEQIRLRFMKVSGTATAL